MCVALLVMIQLMKDVALSRSRGVGFFHTLTCVTVRIETNFDMVPTISVDPIDVYFPTYRSRSMEEYDKQVNLEHAHYL